MQSGTLPDKVVSVFAGMEKDAVMQARSYFTGYAPSSPQFALLRDGQIIAMLERWQIERQHPQTIAAALIQMFNTHCAKEKA
jgi:putative YphP/YqiW family bacilliredoxin